MAAQRLYKVKISPSAEVFYVSLATDPSSEQNVVELDRLLDEIEDDPKAEKNRLAGHLEGKYYRAKSRNFAILYGVGPDQVTIISISPVCDGPTSYEIWNEMVASGKHVQFLRLLGVAHPKAGLPTAHPVQ
jgi:mRNA-degrading endonuclease RelE of RelBE toxin-antitoxin system